MIIMSYEDELKIAQELIQQSKKEKIYLSQISENIGYARTYVSSVISGKLESEMVLDAILKYYKHPACLDDSIFADFKNLISECELALLEYKLIKAAKIIEEMKTIHFIWYKSDKVINEMERILYYVQDNIKEIIVKEKLIVLHNIIDTIVHQPTIFAEAEELAEDRLYKQAYLLLKNTFLAGNYHK